MKKSRGVNWGRKLRIFYLRQFPRRKKMHGGFLHRVLGERLFDRRLWKPERTTVAGGLALGLIVGLLPTFYLQILLSLVFSYLLRVNVTAAVIGTLVTNPLTTPPILLLQYQVGVWLAGPPDPEDLAQYQGVLKWVLGYGKPFLIGSFVSALLAGAAGYACVLIFWDSAVKIRRARRKRMESRGPA